MLVFYFRLVPSLFTVGFRLLVMEDYCPSCWTGKSSYTRWSHSCGCTIMMGVKVTECRAIISEHISDNKSIKRSQWSQGKPSSCRRRGCETRPSRWPPSRRFCSFGYFQQKISTRHSLLPLSTPQIEMQMFYPVSFSNIVFENSTALKRGIWVVGNFISVFFTISIQYAVAHKRGIKYWFMSFFWNKYDSLIYSL